MLIGTREVIHRLPAHWGAQSFPASVTPPAGTAVAPVSSRRQEPRFDERKLCTYELCESIDEEAVVIQQGEVFTLNRSAHGILILMGQAPRTGQLIELRMPESWWRHSMNLYEVQWTKPIQVESQGELFLAGCRLTFGPAHYWTL